MITFDREACVGCGACARDCFPDAITMEAGRPVLSRPDACIRCGHCVAVCPTGAVSMPDADMSEVVSGVPDTDAASLLHLMQFRRSVRQYTAAPVTDEALARLLDAARWCPTAKNAQDTRYIVVREKRQALLSLALGALAQLGEKMLQDPALPADERRRAEKFVRWDKDFRADPAGTDPLFFHAPMLLLFISGPDARDAAAAAAFSGLEAAAMGLGCLFSGYFTAVSASPDIRAMLGLKGGEQVARCLVVGHPAVRFRRTVPRDRADVRCL